MVEFVEKTEWDGLQVELHAHVAKFLACRERAKLSVVSKGFRKACINASLHFPGIKTGILPTEIGRPFSNIISSMRFGVYHLGLSENLSPQGKRLLQQHNSLEPLFDNQLHGDLQLLNGRIFSYWNWDFSGRTGSGIYNYALFNAEQNESKAEAEKHFRYVQCWPRSRMRGNMYVLLERPDGTIIVSQDLKSVYLVQGILSSLAGILVRGGRKLPVQGCGTFLPFHDYIAFDGLIGGSMAPVHASVRKQLYRAYANAMDTGTLITSLPLLPPLQAPVDSPVPQLTAEQQSFLNKIKGMKKTPMSSWVFRRHDYTEAANPYHVITIMEARGGPILVGEQTRALVPTVEELFDLLCKALQQGRSVMGAPITCPQILMTDERSALSALETLLKPAGMQVHFYPPPCEEETEGIFTLGGCANCHIADSTLQTKGLGKLSNCSQCKAVQYCSRECQKAHWKVHKKTCVPIK